MFIARRRLALGWLVIALYATTAVAAIAQDPKQVTPVAVGAAAPAFTAREVDGKVFRFDPKQLDRPTLLIFYRGGWCPYCNTHLHELQSVEPRIVALGYRVLFLSTDRPEILYSSLKEKVNYHIVSDSAANAARAFGVAYRLDDATYDRMKSFGVDLEAAQGDTGHVLPVPSVFIVDRSGTVRFRHFNSDYRVRLDAPSVLAAAEQALVASQPRRAAP
jgi:peroxiredoxin